MSEKGVQMGAKTPAMRLRNRRAVGRGSFGIGWFPCGPARMASRSATLKYRSGAAAVFEDMADFAVRIAQAGKDDLGLGEILGEGVATHCDDAFHFRGDGRCHSVGGVLDHDALGG